MKKLFDDSRRASGAAGRLHAHRQARHPARRRGARCRWSSWSSAPERERRDHGQGEEEAAGAGPARRKKAAATEAPRRAGCRGLDVRGTRGLTLARTAAYKPGHAASPVQRRRSRRASLARSDRDEAHLEALLRDALDRAVDAGELRPRAPPLFALEVPSDTALGDLASNVALVLARARRAGRRARSRRSILAPPPGPEGLARRRPRSPGPGFINFRFAPRVLADDARARRSRPATAYGRADVGRGRSVQVEFVSANPTGPLHVGHGRGAVTRRRDRAAARGGRLRRRARVLRQRRGPADGGCSARRRAARYRELCGRDVAVPRGRLPGRLHASTSRGELARGARRRAAGDARRARRVGALPRLRRRDAARRHHATTSTRFGIALRPLRERAQLHDGGAFERRSRRSPRRPGLRATTARSGSARRVRRRQGPRRRARQRRAHLLRRRHRLPPRQARARLRAR